jgi:hypothetical protein
MVSFEIKSVIDVDVYATIAQRIKSRVAVSVGVSVGEDI